MADRAANRESVGTRLIVFTRSLVLFGLVAVGLPLALVVAARERFGGGAPFHGVASPADWSANRIRTALTERLTEQTITDIVIRLALVVAWVGVIVLVVSVVAEVAHMLRHDGLAMPDIRGLGFTQRTARVIASGLLVVVPLFTSPTSAVANQGATRLPDRSVAAVLRVERPTPGTGSSAAHASTSAAGSRLQQPVSAEDAPFDIDSSTAERAEPTAAPGEYIVQPGDSVYGIAERLVGPDSSRVAAFAERLVDLNLGRRMPDGRRFDNAAFIDVGWVLELPDGAGAAPSQRRDVAGTHVVEEGESLWSIAEDELGDPTRWPEVYGANEGREFDDGRRLTDPDLIRPGWDLRLPTDAPADVAEAPIPESDDVDSSADITTPALVEDEVAVPDRLAASLDVDAPANSGAPADATVVDDATVVGDVVASSRRDNVWDEVGADTPGAVDATASAGDGTDERVDAGDSRSAAPRMMPLGGAAMMSAGVLTLLAVRRRAQLRRARPRTSLPEPSPRPAATERTLRAIDVGERFVRVETAIRAVAMTLVERDRRVVAVLVAPEGSLELRTSGPVALPSPWDGDGSVWHLAASIPLELLADAARTVNSPCPTLVQLGTDDAGRDVYVDLEAIEAIEVGGPGAQADAFVAALAATLAGSLLAEVTTLIGLGVPDEAFLAHRRYVPAPDQQRAFEASAEAIGSTRGSGRSTFALRSTGTATETWEPAVVLIGASAGTVPVPDERTGLAVVSASPIHGPSSRLAPDGDAWLLQPAGIRLTPVGLSPDDIAAIAELVTITDPEPETHTAPAAAPSGTVPLDRAALGEHTIIDPHDVPERPDAVDAPAEARLEPNVGPAPSYELLVRMIGPVGVIDREGNEVSFERSKTRELVAWLATHRERSTRSAARTALWELDVRDATFANVVSEARRSLARLVEPPEGDEWVGRTMTDALPLHELVRSDADLLRHALEVARLQPPAQAIATLDPAVELITGMPFEGTSYLWPDSEGITSDFVLLATTATTELGAHCLSIGDIEGVFRATARGLQVLPAHEELIGLRMEAHARAGDHAGVRQEWESYERVINGDPWSDGEPAPKLVELRKRLLNPSR